MSSGPLAIQARSGNSIRRPPIPELATRLGIRTGGDAPDEHSEGPSTARSANPGRGGVRKPPAEIERPKSTFKDVGGDGRAQDEIRMKIIHPLTHADLYKAYGKAIGAGSSCTARRAAARPISPAPPAGEIKAGFMAIGINDVLEMWIGRSEQNLHAVFEQARPQSSRACCFFQTKVAPCRQRARTMRTHGRASHHQPIPLRNGGVPEPATRSC